MPPPTKRLVVLYDGTSNTPKDRTNVWRTHELLSDKGSDNVPQEKKYIQGVGTEVGELVRGSIFGTGVARKIREGYEWLVENYQDDAEIYVFGFSRGAFTARSLVQMIATCGLTRRETLKEWDAEQTFDHYESISMQETEEVHPIWRLRYWQRHPEEKPPGWQPTADDVRLMDDAKVRVVKVRMAGLWDTVGAIGKDFAQNRDASTQKSASHNVRPTKAQEYGYHALAIDEHRPMFEATLWRTFVEAGKEKETMDKYAKYYEQHWFIGAHSDVGGGYGDDDLPDLSLNWMMKKGSALGLAFSHSVESRAGAWHDTIHDSFESFAGHVLSIWDNLLPGDQRNYREIGKLPKEVQTVDGTTGLLWSINETIDESVLLRVIEDSTYRPPRLMDYFRGQLKASPDFLKDLFSKYIPKVDLDAGFFPNIFAQRTQRIYANKYWNETGVQLRPGMKYRFKVVPGIGEPLRDAEYLSPGIEGQDWKSTAHKTASFFHGKRKDDAKWFALIGTIDKEHPWVITDGGTFEAKVGGQLLCYFNDVQLEWFYGNNSGWIVLEVEQV